MAVLQLTPPGSFNFNSPDEWPRWKKRFQQFRDASGLSDLEQPKQINTLLYCMGPDAEDVLDSTNPTAAEKRAYVSVIAKFDSFFKVRRNIIFERARFNRRNQLDEESVEQYITHLYQLAENCDYAADIKDEMIRDRLVVGIRDTKMSETLQMDPELTLEKAKQKIRQKDAIKEQQQILTKDGIKQESDLEEVHGQRRKKYGRRYSGQKVKQTGSCSRCGREQHARDKCPARDATCHCCKKKGHYSSKCYSKKRIEEVTAGLDAAYLDTLSANGTSWEIQLLLEGTEITCKLDTGAEVTVISEQTYAAIKKPRLFPPSKSLYGPSRQPLEVIGQFTGTFSHKGKSILHPVFVVKKLKTNLLGLPAISSLPELIM